MSKRAVEQALVALIAEAKKEGVDIGKISKAAIDGILGNEPYTWIQAQDKPAAMDALKGALEKNGINI